MTFDLVVGIMQSVALVFAIIVFSMLLKQSRKPVKIMTVEEAVRNRELIEILSAIEHDRWASWQKYVHSKCVKNEDGSLTIPVDSVVWW